MTHKIFCMAVGIGTKKSFTDKWLEVFYPKPILNPQIDVIKAIEKLFKIDKPNNISIELNSKNCHALEDLFFDIGQEDLAEVMLILETSDRPRVLTILYNDIEPTDTPEIYLKLQLISHRLIKPNQINLTNIFNILPTVAWTSEGAIDPEELAQQMLLFRQKGITCNVFSVDKFPKMSNYVVPSNVRIADTARVRLGAYIGSGTTIMHEGFINFNAGTETNCMIEGRVSSGIIVGSESDLGGGCSTMGTLSGGNDLLISIGEHCLIGANAGVGIPLGDNCTVEAGLYITSSSKVTVLTEDQDIDNKIVKAIELSGKSNLIFRRNSISGRIECLYTETTRKINEQLHNNN